MRVVFASDGWPTDLPDTEDLVLPTSRHWRLLQRIHGPGTGQLSQRCAALTPAERDTLRFPHPRSFRSSTPGPFWTKQLGLVRGLAADGSSMRRSLPVSTTGVSCGSVQSGMSAGCSPTLPKNSALPSTSPPERVVPGDSPSGEFRDHLGELVPQRFQQGRSPRVSRWLNRLFWSQRDQPADGRLGGNGGADPHHDETTSPY